MRSCTDCRSPSRSPAVESGAKPRPPSTTITESESSQMLSATSAVALPECRMTLTRHCRTASPMARRVVSSRRAIEARSPETSIASPSSRASSMARCRSLRYQGSSPIGSAVVDSFREGRPRPIASRSAAMRSRRRSWSGPGSDRETASSSLSTVSWVSAARSAMSERLSSTRRTSRTARWMADWGRPREPRVSPSKARTPTRSRYAPSEIASVVNTRSVVTAASRTAASASAKPSEAQRIPARAPVPVPPTRVIATTGRATTNRFVSR